MIEWILIIIIIFYDLYYIKSLPLLALILAVLIANNNIYVWVYSFLIAALVYEIAALLKGSKIVEYDDYIHISNSICLLPNLSIINISIFSAVYLLLLFLASKYYKVRVPTSAQLYISSIIVLIYYYLLF